MNTSLHAGLTSSVIHHVLSTESFINYFIHIVLLLLLLSLYTIMMMVIIFFNLTNTFITMYILAS